MRGAGVAPVMQALQQASEMTRLLPRDTWGVILVIAVAASALHLRFTRRTALAGPGLLTTLGILATFFGIARGLSSFDARDVKASVPALIAGLSTAFWASVAGVLGALTLKLRALLAPPPPAPGDPAPAALTAIADQIAQRLGPDASLVHEIRKLRREIVAQLKTQTMAHEQALAVMARSGSQALVEALRDIVFAFNERLGLQFGENFARLERAAVALVAWQEQYHAILERDRAALADASTALQDSRAMLQDLLLASQGLAGVVAPIETSLASLNQTLPGLSATTHQLAAALVEVRSALPTLHADWEALASAMTTSMQAAAQSLQHAGETATRDLAATTDDLRQSTGVFTQALRAQSRALEQEIETSLTAALTTLATQLTALSEKFVADYEPLTRALQQLMGAVRSGIT